MTYYKQKLDANHTAIKQHLEKHGVEVIEMLKPLDLLVGYKGNICWLECKVPGSAAKFTAVQLRFIANTKFPVIIAKNEAEAFQFVRDRVYVTQKQKDALGALLAINGKAFYQPSEIEAVLHK